MEDLSMSGKRPFRSRKTSTYCQENVHLLSGKRPLIVRKTSTYCQENVHLNPLKAIHYKGYKRPIKYKFKNIYKFKKVPYLWITLFLTLFFTIVDSGD